MDTVKKAAPYVIAVAVGVIFANQIKSAVSRVPVVNRVPGL